MSEKVPADVDLHRKLLLAVIALAVWGPPRLRLGSRPLETSLEDPLSWDWAIWLQVSAVTVLAVVAGLVWIARGIDRPPLPQLLRRGPGAAYFLFGALALGSTVYSPYPWYTAFFSLRLLAGIAAVALLMDQPSPQSTSQLLRVFYGVFLAQWIAVLSLYLYNPDLVGDYLPGVGYRLHARIFNDFGMSGAISLFYFLISAREFRSSAATWLCVALSALAVWSVYVSRTRSTVVIAIILLILAALQLRRPGRWLFLWVSVLCTWLALATTWKLEIFDYLLRGQQLADLRGLTGRANAFAYLMEYWQQRPWFGYGFAAGTRVLLVSFVRQTGLGIGSAHDALSKVLVELGLIGCAVLCLTFVWAWIRWLQYRPDRGLDADGYTLWVQAGALLATAALRSVVSEGVADFSAAFIVGLAVCESLRRGQLVSRERHVAAATWGRRPLPSTIWG